MSSWRILPIVSALILVMVVACTNAPASSSQVAPEPDVPDAATVTPVPPTAAPAPEPSATSEPTVAPEPPSEPNAASSPTISTSGNPEAPLALTSRWPNTDFSKHSVPFFEIISGGVPRDGIPPIDSPLFLDVSETPEYMQDNDPVIALDIGGEARAYPLDILQGHEIVNDELAGIPVTVTFCPLCNTAIVFDRRVDGRVFDFGVSGNLRNSDLIMWDRQTESWWQQVTGESIVGEMTGTQLEIIPAPVISWDDFMTSFPEGELLSRETGGFRNYDNAPYDGYDDLAQEVPFLFFDSYELDGIRSGADPVETIKQKLDGRLVPMERVASLKIDDEAVAYPFSLLREQPVVNDTVGGQDIVLFYAGATLSAFEGSGGAANRIVGSTGVYDPLLDGEKLSFSAQGDSIVDDGTGSRWNILGRAIEGPLAGEQLEPVAHANHFWFAWAAFNPDTEIRSASDFDE